MDPNACFRYMLDNESDCDTYNDCKAHLIAWLRGGGFGPSVVYAPHALFNPSIPGAYGRGGTLVALTYTGDATVRWRNNRRSVVRLAELGYA